jgi:protocatechuate 4,5-dioxygenase, beta chain
MTTCQEMKVDHGFAVPMSLLWGHKDKIPVRTVPIVINTVQYPLPTPARCYKLGKALGKAIEASSSDAKVVIVGTGGLSHQLDGERAGFINKKFDLMCMDKIVNDPEVLTRYSIHDIVRNAGAQGAELILWLAMRGALSEKVSKVHSNYHIPISNTASGLLVLENAA